MKYRLSLKLCARTFCFSPVSTDGVMVMANPPVTGDIIVEHQNTTVTGGAEKVGIQKKIFSMILKLKKVNQVLYFAVDFF